MSASKLDKKSKILIVGAVITGIGTIVASFIGIIPDILHFKTTQTLQGSTPETRILDVIQFDYSDSPINHGWNFSEGDFQKVIFEEINDAAVGKALKITTSDDNFYAIDFDEFSLQGSEFGNFLEITAKFPDQSSSLYAYVSLINDTGDTSYGWLKFKVGKEQKLPSQKTTGEPEWLVYVYPESFLDQNWVKMQIDLNKTVQETFGKDGWSFHKLIKFRIRGNLWVDYIGISEITMK